MINSEKNSLNNKKNSNENNFFNNDFNFEREMENSMRNENDSMIEQVSSKVRNIKKYAIEIGNKIKLSNAQMDEMDKKYNQSNNLMTKTMQKLNEVFNNNTNYWCYLMIFIIVLFFFLYKLH
jgi:hypothetical protein